MTSSKTKIFCISLGCPKNQADIELILACLQQKFGKLKFVNRPKEADLLLINTCSFIEEAVSESVEAIIEAGQEKSNNQTLCVIGCLPLRYKKELKDLLPEVDFFSFDTEPEDIAASLINFLEGKPQTAATCKTERLITKTPWSAYVKIADGCSRTCTYCLIPKIKGGFRSKHHDVITKEIEYLCSKGAKEITLVAQDLTSYRSNDIDLKGLLRLILKKTEVKWLRLMYLHPLGLEKELLELIKNEDRICKYLDIPIQHASSKVLKKMGRQIDNAKLEEIFHLVYATVPDISIRTTVMVGFPGEDEEDFNTLLSFIEKWRFHHLGCFVYSDEEEAPSNKLQPKVKKDIAIKRKEIIMDLQKEISKAINNQFIGKKIPVLVDGLCPETDLLLCGRARFQAPEIDGKIYINKGEAVPGQIHNVLITEAHHFDLVGELL